MARVGFAVENAEKPVVPGSQFRRVKGVVETEKPDAMAHTAESLSRTAAHALRGAVGTGELRMG